jgi:hypothetical protein
MAVKEVAIKKKSGGVRKLGIPTILDRIAQEVVKTHLERIVEPRFQLKKWVKWEKRLYKMASARWLKKKHEERPNLFAHWKLVYP